MWKEHHLSEEHDKIICPLNRKYLCNGHCAWFDHEEQDCRMIGGFMKVREGLTEIDERLFQVSEVIKEGFIRRYFRRCDNDK